MVDAAICDGDIVTVRRQDSADQGNIVAALLEDEATVKGATPSGRKGLAGASQPRLRADPR
jgi:SOS-response transcriptional repressor LexA